ncbi:MAG: hypothetical protein NTZ90_11625 [Proteobacteria bacterium]|nr:hypothetical protein [Pseudomonadota bacterium]
MMRQVCLKILPLSLLVAAALSGCGGSATPQPLQPESSVSTTPAALGPGTTAGDAPTVTSEDMAFTVASKDAARDVKAANVRYLSLAHLQSAGAPADQLVAVRKGTAKLFNSLSWAPALVAPVVVDAGSLLLKINLADYGWSVQMWETLVAAHPSPVATTPGLGALQQATGSTKPLIRADWFVASASTPPLYYTLWQAPADVTALESMLKMDLKADVANGQVIRAGLSKSNISTNDRVIERHNRATGYLWRSFEFGSRTGTRDIFSFPLGSGGSETNTAQQGGLLGSLLGGSTGSSNGQSTFTADGTEYIFTLPNGMLAFYIAGGNGARLNQVPGAASPILAGAGCMGCHSKATVQATDEMIAKTRVTGDALTAVRKLYVDAATFSRQVSGDSAAYVTALAKLGIAATDADPVSYVAKLSNGK